MTRPRRALEWSALEWSDPSRPPTPREDHTGRVLADRYRLDGVMALTTTSTIYRAHDSRGSAPVVVKLLHPEIHVDPARVERFKREAKILANLRHTHIADFIDTDSTPEGLLYIVTALIDGRPLVEWCSGDARLDAETICRIGVQVAEGLAYMHRAGVIHRDVKASNIIWPKDQVAKLIDFGLAKLTASASLELTPPRHPTVAGVPIGTPGYMPPEAVEGVDARTDVFGLARTLYRLLTHRPAGSWPEGLDQVPDPLARLIRAAGDPQADLRPATMDEFRGRLHAARAHVVPSPAMRPARHLWPVPADRKPAPHSEPGNTAAPAGDPCTTSPTSQLFERRLELRLPLREGSAGQTWRAYHHILGGDVVVKIVPPAKAEQEEGDKLRREAAALFQLQHSAFPQIYDSDSAEADGCLYLVEEWIKGETFFDMMRRGRPDLLLAVELVGQLADALALAHSRGIVHGDVHPGNFMIEEAKPPRARVIDLNQCVLLDHFHALSAERFATPPHLRPPHRPKPFGLVAFLAPEVARGGRQTVLSDLYGLGAVLFALVTGVEVPAAELRAILEAGPREEYGKRLAAYLVDRVPDLEESELLDVIGVVLAPEPERRALNAGGLLNMSGFARALRTTADSIRETRTPPDPGRPPRPKADPPAPSPAPPASPAPASAPPATASAPQPAAPLPRRFLLAAAGLVLFGAVLGAALITASSREESAPVAELNLEPSLPPPTSSREESEPVAEPTLEPSLPPPAPSPALDPGPPSQPPTATAPQLQPKVSRRERPQAPLEPVTVDEATEAASVALAGIRERCVGAPKVIAAELDIEDGRGKVARLNFKPAAGFQADSWEKCARGELEHAKFPKRATQSHVVLRLQR